MLLAEDGFYNPGNHLHSNLQSQVCLARHTIVSICDSPNHTRVPELQLPQSQMYPKAALSWLLAKKEKERQDEEELEEVEEKKRKKTCLKICVFEVCMEADFLKIFVHNVWNFS